MKRIHIVLATVGLVCAGAFALVPLAHGEAAASHTTAATPMSNVGLVNNNNSAVANPVRKHMNRGKVTRNDGGC